MAKRFFPSISIKTHVDELVYRHADEVIAAAKSGAKLTTDEVTALQIINRKDLTNRITRIIGLFSIMFFIVLMVGCFLYPFSIFNLFGEGNRFWDCWSKFPVYAKNMEIVIDITSGETAKWSGWLTLGQIYDGIGFTKQATPIINFYALGGWSIILIASVGLVVIVVAGAYLLFDSIKDLIILLQDIRLRTRSFVQDIATTAKESVNSTLTPEEVAAREAHRLAEKQKLTAEKVIMEVSTPEVKKGRGRPKKIKPEPEPKPVIEQPVVATSVKVTPAPVKVAEPKEQPKVEPIIEDVKVEPQPAPIIEKPIPEPAPAVEEKPSSVNVVSEADIKNMSDDQLDAILNSGDSLESIFNKNKK